MKQTLQELLSKYEKGICTQEEIKLLYRFYDSSQNEEDIWEGQEAAEKERVHKELRERLARGMVKPGPRKILSYKQVWRVAATLALLIGIGVFATFDMPQESDTIAFESFVSGDKGVKKITLIDGTSVWLNRNSELTVPKNYGNSMKREVKLSGEAYFEVAHNEQRPFLVRSGHLTTKVLGTKFNVMETAQSAEISLLEGSVEVSSTSDKIHLEPMQKVAMTHDSKLSLRALDGELELAWMSNTFHFEHTQLSRVALLLERRFHISIAFAQDGLQEKAVTGTYHDESLNTILYAITRAGGLDYEYIDAQHVNIYEPTKTNTMN